MEELDAIGNGADGGPGRPRGMGGDAAPGGYLPGVGLVLGVGVVSMLVSSVHAAFDSLVLSLIFGMLVANVLEDRTLFARGIEITLRVCLPIGIGIMGAQVVLPSAGAWTWAATAGIFAASFAIAYFIARSFGLGTNLSFLLGTGLSVCGASAIAAVAPILGVKKRDMSIAIISVMMVGLVGMLAYRFLPEVLGLTLSEFSFITGATLPMFGQVVVAATPMGPQVLSDAVTVKLIRVCALALVAGAAFLVARGEGADRRVPFPWFMVAFIVLMAAANALDAPPAVRDYASALSKFFLTTALAAIGLSLDFESITEYGAGPLFAAALAWSIVVLSIYLALSVFL